MNNQILLFSLYAFCSGYVLDLIVGDPKYIYHFVRLIGSFISLADKSLNRFPEKKNYSLIVGILTSLLITGLSCILVYYVGLWLYVQNIWFGFVFETFFVWQCLATKSLRVESMYVYKDLKANNLIKARKSVGRIVGRDTENLDSEGVSKAAVETVAENTCDGIVSPILYISLFGAIGGVFSKVVNTLDSMIGYKNEKYRYFGTGGALTDDIVQFIPARLSAYYMILASFLLRLNWKNAIKIFHRDRFKHASINSAQTESVCAGALSLQLAGDAVYGGVVHKKEFIGDPVKRIEIDDIKKANKLMTLTSFISFVFAVIIRVLIYKIARVF